MTEQEGLKEPISTPEKKDENLSKDSMLNAALTMGESKFRQRRRKKVSYLTINKIEKIDYKDTALLKRFLNDFGKIVSSRLLGTTAKQQRDIARAVHRAREIALLPFVVTEITANDRGFGRGMGRRGRPTTTAAPEETTPPVAKETTPPETAPAA